jgi:hypothetical protein
MVSEAEDQIDKKLDLQLNKPEIKNVIIEEI